MSALVTPSPPAFAIDASPDTWRAELELRFSKVKGRTILRRKHTGPLVVQRALYPEGPSVCHVIVVHPPGGIVSGDELHLNVHVTPETFAQLTTPGAGKWYRSSGREASQRLVMCVEDACLEWLPQETIVFDAAKAQMTTEIELRGKARFLGWEILCLGRRAAGESFHQGRIRQVTSIRHDTRLLFCERARLEGHDSLLSSPIGLGGHSVTAVMWLAGATVDAGTVTACRRARPEEAAARVGLSAMPGLLVARYLGDSSEAAKRYFIELFRILRPTWLGRDAVLPRIWST